MLLFRSYSEFSGEDYSGSTSEYRDIGRHNYPPIPFFTLDKTAMIDFWEEIIKF